MSEDLKEFRFKVQRLIQHYQWMEENAQTEDFARYCGGAREGLSKALDLLDGVSVDEMVS